MHNQPISTKHRAQTHKFLVLAAVLDLDVGLSTLVKDLEGEVLHIRLHFSIRKLATDETLGVEHANRR